MTDTPEPAAPGLIERCRAKLWAYCDFKPGDKRSILIQDRHIDGMASVVLAEYHAWLREPAMVERLAAQGNPTMCVRAVLAAIAREAGLDDGSAT